MNKVLKQRIKVALSTVVALVLLFIGLGCTYIALTNIKMLNVQTSMENSSLIYKITDIERKIIELSIKKTPVIIKTENIQELVVSDEVVFLSTPVKGEQIGSMWIPSLGIEAPIIEGTDAEELDKGVGHYIQSVLPGEWDNCVLSGHRDTVFMKLGDIVIGDNIVVKTDMGIFIYRVSGMRIVDKDDKTVIVSTETPVLTITTCYPFIFIGPAPERFIVIADLIRSD